MKTNNNHVDNPFNSPAILSLCPGIRGLERGIERVIGPVRTVAYVEIEAFCAYNLVAQMEAGELAAAPVFSDIKTFDAKPFRNRIHGITGGYPCQGESSAGKKQFEKDDRFLWNYIESIIRSVNPVWCFFENVPNHIHGTFPYVLSSLRAMGYSVEAGIFSAEEVGSPQQRERLFIFAMANSESQRIRRLSKQQPGQTWQVEKQISDTERRNKIMVDTNSNDGRIVPGTEFFLGNSQHNEELLSGESNKETKQRFISHSGPKEFPNTLRHGIRQSHNKSISGEFNEDGERWPSRPGCPQKDWEYGRIESSMVYTIDGYNFTEDLSRAIGNSVVEQTASKAFITLLNKMLNQ